MLEPGARPELDTALEVVLVPVVDWVEEPLPTALEEPEVSGVLLDALDP